MPPLLPLRHIAMIPARTQVRVRSSGDTKYALKVSSTCEKFPCLSACCWPKKVIENKEYIKGGDGLGAAVFRCRWFRCSRDEPTQNLFVLLTHPSSLFPKDRLVAFDLLLNHSIIMLGYCQELSGTVRNCCVKRNWCVCVQYQLVSKWLCVARHGVRGLRCSKLQYRDRMRRTSRTAHLSPEAPAQVIAHASSSTLPLSLSHCPLSISCLSMSLSPSSHFPLLCPYTFSSPSY
jgi:hypothetical protein